MNLGGGDIRMTTKYLNHPILCLGYRIEYRGRIFCTAYDTEPFQNIFCTDPSDPSYDEAMAKEGEIVAKEENEKLEEFYKGADLLVYDAQYTQEEYRATKVGWGHSSIEYAISAAKKNGVKKLILFHHEPLYSDAKLDALTEKLLTDENTGGMEVVFAREGMEIEL